MAVETPIQDLVETAVAKGWEEREVLSAIIEVCENLVLAAQSNDKLNTVLSAIRKRDPGAL